MIGYWHTVQHIMTGLQQQKTGCTSWTKTSRLQSQIEETIFAFFWAGETLEAKPYSFAIFLHSKLVDATLGKPIF